MAIKRNAAMAAVLLALMMMSALSSSSCYARTVVDEANGSGCFPLEKCDQERCGMACSLSEPLRLGPATMVEIAVVPSALL